MAIEFNCPYCTASIRVAGEAAGKIGRCPKCNSRLRVPRPELPVNGTSSVRSTAPGTSDPDSRTKPAVQSDDDFDALELEDLPHTDPDPSAVVSSEPAAVSIPDVPQLQSVLQRQADSSGPLIDVGDALEPTYRRVVAARDQRNWTALLAPLLCGGILLAAGLAYWWTHRETMTGELTGERLPPETTVSTTIQRFVLDVPNDVWQASLIGLGEEPVIVHSELLMMEIAGGRRGLKVSVAAGSETDLVRVHVRQNRVLNEFCIRRAEMLDDARVSELADGATRFLQDWHNAVTAGMLMGNGRQYRDSVGLNALRRGLGYHSIALVGNTLYPCVYEDRDGWLYFVVPRGTHEFLIIEREVPDGDSVFPTEYRFTVRIPMPAADPDPESAEIPADDAGEPSTDSEPEGQSPTSTSVSHGASGEVNP